MHPGISVWLSSPGSRWAPAGHADGSFGGAGLSQVTARKLLRQLKVVVSNKLWPSILPLAKLVHSTG